MRPDEREVIARAVERLRATPYFCNKCGFFGELDPPGIHTEHTGCHYLAAQSRLEIEVANDLEALLDTDQGGLTSEEWEKAEQSLGMKGSSPLIEPTDRSSDFGK